MMTPNSTILVDDVEIINNLTTLNSNELLYCKAGTLVLECLVHNFMRSKDFSMAREGLAF